MIENMKYVQAAEVEVEGKVPLQIEKPTAVVSNRGATMFSDSCYDCPHIKKRSTFRASPRYQQPDMQGP